MDFDLQMLNHNPKTIHESLDVKREFSHQYASMTLILAKRSFHNEA